VSAVNEEALKPDKAGSHWPDATSSAARVHSQTQSPKTCKQANARKGLEVNRSSDKQNAFKV